MTPAFLGSSPAWTAAGWTMLHLAWVETLVGLAAALLRRGLRGSRPEIRHGTAVACLLGVSAAPIVLFAWLLGAARPVPDESPLVPRSAATVSEPASVEPAPPFERSRTLLLSPSVQASRLSPSRFEPLVGYLPGVWLAGSLATLALLGTGLAGVERLRRASRPLDSGPIADRYRALAASLAVAGRSSLAVCDRIAAPLLIGVVRPLILLPPAALCGWSLEQVEMALLHELAHLRRRDNLVALFQRLAESWLFFHPVTWWLSSWISLEREVCCDRLVVERTGRPHDYARLLASLAGVSCPALGMAAHPLSTRIRRILNMEERPMKLTSTEGLALLAAAIAGATLALTGHAAPPSPAPPDQSARKTLTLLSERADALPEGRTPGEDRCNALVSIAEAQIALGDRDGALATIRRIESTDDPTPPKPGAPFDMNTYLRVAARVEAVTLYQEAGDRDGARKALDRAGRLADALLDPQALRGMVDRTSRDMDAIMAKPKPANGLRRLTDEEAAMACELSGALIVQCIEVGDLAQARERVRQLCDAGRPAQSTMRIAMLAEAGALLTRAGDREGGRALIGEARQAAMSLEPQGRAFILTGLAGGLVEIGDLDGAFALIHEIEPESRPKALTNLIEAMATETHDDPWFDAGGIKIGIGSPSLRPKDRAATRAALPKVAAEARALGDVRDQARSLATVALLQARAGDIEGALATARSIPLLVRSAHAGANDGYYEAVKPVALARLAGIMAESGDRPRALAVLAEAEALARAAMPADQTLVARIVVARTYAACGRAEAARAVVADALPLARVQPEPRRSRVLSMLVDAQVEAGDLSGAGKTIKAIRNTPGLEKARAALRLARAYDDAGETASAAAVRRETLADIEAKTGAKPPTGPAMPNQGFARETFVDYDLELSPNLLEYWRGWLFQSLHAPDDDVTSLVRNAKDLPRARRGQALVQAVTARAQRGDPAGALELASSIEATDARLRAFAAIATSLSQSRTRK